MHRRLRQEDKQEYKIRPNSTGLWQGSCPECNEVFTAEHELVPQAIVVKHIREHQREVHDNKHFTSDGEVATFRKPQCKVWGCTQLDYMPTVEMCHIHWGRVRNFGSPFGYQEGRVQRNIETEKKNSEKVMKTAHRSLSLVDPYNKLRPELTGRRKFIQYLEDNNIRLNINLYSGEPTLAKVTVPEITPTPTPIETPIEVESTSMQPHLDSQDAINTNLLNTIETVMSLMSEMATQINNLSAKVDELERKESRSNPLADLREQLRGRGV